MNPSLSLDRAALPSFWPQNADLAHHTDITLQDVPNREYTLRLFGEGEEIEVQKTDNWSWTPAQHQCALYFTTTYMLKAMRF